MRADGEGGTGVVATTFGFGAFLGFLLLASNLTVGLWARSAATAISFDEARRLAITGPGCAANAAEASTRTARMVGRWWHRVDATATCSADVVTLHVLASDSRSILPTALDRLDRTFIVRIESER